MNLKFLNKIRTLNVFVMLNLCLLEMNYTHSLTHKGVHSACHTVPGYQ